MRNTLSIYFLFAPLFRRSIRYNIARIDRVRFTLVHTRPHVKRCRDDPVGDVSSINVPHCYTLETRVDPPQVRNLCMVFFQDGLSTRILLKRYIMLTTWLTGEFLGWRSAPLCLLTKGDDVFVHVGVWRKLKHAYRDSE